MQRRIWIGFAALCTLSASAWIVDAYVPSALTPVLQIAVHYTILCALFLGVRLSLRRDMTWPKTKVCSRIVLFGIALFALPPLVFAEALGQVSKFTEVLIFTLVPLIVVLVGSQRARGFGLEADSMRLIGPALAATGGAAILLPFELPSSISGTFWLIAMVATAVLTGVAAIRLNDLFSSSQFSLLDGASLICAGSAVLLWSFCFFLWTTPGGINQRGLTNELGRCLLLDGPTLLLSVWLIREMQPVHFSTRYFIVPFITIVEGVIVMRPEVSVSMVAGAVLLLIGSAMLLKAD